MLRRSLSCTVVEMLTGYPPYYGLPEPVAMKEIITGVEPSYNLPTSASDEVKNFLRRCFKIERKERPTATELLADPFINGLF